MSEIWRFGPPLPPVEIPEAARSTPDWKQAQPAAIARALKRALERPHGNWYVVDASRRLGATPRRFRIAGEDLVAWRADGEILMAPDACPHMGASLEGCRVRDGKLVCPWHGLALGKAGHGPWKPYAVHDDGVLAWVRVGPEDPATPKPVLPPRPDALHGGRRPPGGALRPRRRHRQPARPVARRPLPPLLLRRPAPSSAPTTTC